MKAAVVAAVVAAAVSAQTLVQGEAQRLAGRGPYVTRLMPPVMRMREADSLPQFFARTDSLKSALDRAREEEPPDDALLPFASDP